MTLDISQQLLAIEHEKENLLPTPSVSTPIQWFLGGHGEAQAAIVSKVESPGKLSVTIFPPNGMPFVKRGVLWKRCEQAVKNPHDPQVHRSGAWDYPLGTNIPKQHLQLHTAMLEQKEKGLIKQKEAYDQAEFNRLEKEKATVAAK
jgi:hypothetical protein